MRCILCNTDGIRYVKGKDFLNLDDLYMCLLDGACINYEYVVNDSYHVLIDCSFSLLVKLVNLFGREIILRDKLIDNFYVLEVYDGYRE